MAKEKLNVQLNQSINGVEFGSDANIVRNVFGKQKRSFKKSVFSKGHTDVYDGFHIYYSSEGTFEAIEIFGDTEAYVDGHIVFPGNVSNLHAVIPDLKGNGGEFISEQNSVGVMVNDDGMTIESILFGRKNYYGT